MSAKQPNIIVFLWDNLGWGEVGCYGGGVLRGAPTPRIDGLAADGRRLLNFSSLGPGNHAPPQRWKLQQVRLR